MIKNQNPEDPLESLRVGKSPKDMDEEELRAYVVRLNELRYSSQSRAAHLRGSDKKKEVKGDFDEF